MSKSNFSFRITAKESIGEYSISATSNVVLDENLCENYSADAIAKAKQLKAKHGDKYSDAYYLNYGKSLVLQGLISANKEIHKRRLAGCDIQNIDWAGYSYEEIIAMEANGYTIPEEVLLWAHSQQEADVTDYVMVSESMTLEDNTTDATGTAQDELSNLKKKTQEHISKSEKAQKKLEQDIEKYNEVEDKAQNIKEKKEDTYKNAMDEISSKTEEWKKLDEKRKSGKLTKAEEKKYNDLSKQLNGTNGTLMKEIQADNSDLDEFLTSLTDLDKDITTNLTLAQNTIKAGQELGAYNKNYNTAQLPVALSGITIDGNGNSYDTLYGIKNYDVLSKLAIDKGQALNEISENLNSELTNDKTTNLSEFATDYTTLATQTEENTQNAMGDKFTTNNNSQSSKTKDYSIDKGFSYENSISATTTTLMSTADVLSKDNSVSKNNKQLQKEIKTAQKDSANLTKKSNTANKKLSSIKTEEEQFLTELDSLQSNSDKKAEKQGEIKTQQDSLISQLSQKQDESKTIEKDVQKAKGKSIASTTKGEKLTKTLTNKNSKLKSRNQNAEKVAKDTQIVGAGTVAKGVINTSIGSSLQATGMSMMFSPVTYSNGVVLYTLGTLFLEQGEKELIFGAVAVGTGVIGEVATNEAAETNRDAISTIKNANQVFKLNKEKIKNSSELASENTEQTQTTNNQTEESSTSGTETSSASETTEPSVTTEPENSSENTQETDITKETDKISDTTQETPETENQTADTELNETQDSEAQQNQDKNATESVDIKFTTENAIKATSINKKATSELEKDEQNMNKVSALVKKDTKQSETLTKNIDSETSKAIALQQVNFAEAEAITNKQTEAENEIQNATTNEETITAQTKIANLSAQLSETATKDEQSTTNADKTILKSVQNLAKFQNNAQSMNKDLSELNKNIANQQKISTKTLVVGAGTTTVGAININKGIGMILSGLSLMANPFTYSAGLMQVISGGVINAQGLAETASGTVATVTAVDGLTTNEKTNTTSKNSKISLNDANTQSKKLEKKANTSTKEIGKNQAIKENPKAQTNTEDKEDDEDIMTLSASASSNSNIGDNVLTDDKADRKLARFNTESIIESKKKRKKVQGVFATSKG